MFVNVKLASLLSVVLLVMTVKAVCPDGSVGVGSSEASFSVSK